MKVIYQGIPQEQQEKLLTMHMAQKYPPSGIDGETPAKEPYHHIEDRDGALTIEKKKQRIAEWMAKRETEHREFLASLDACKELEGIKFPKGETVEVSDTSPLVMKSVVIDGKREQVRGSLFGYIADGVFVQAEKDEQADSLPTEAELQAPVVKRGRPRKAA